MAINSRSKGKRGELLAVKYLKSLGFQDARRTQQFNGLGKSDVACEESLKHIHIEVKNGNQSNHGVMDLGCSGLYGSMSQAESDCDGKFPVVLWKPDRKKWRLSYMGCMQRHMRTTRYICITVCGDEDVRDVLTNLNNDMEAGSNEGMEDT